MGKRKEWHSSNQIMVSSFSFTALAKARVTRLYHKCMLKKKKKSNLSLISVMSSRIQATLRVGMTMGRVWGGFLYAWIRPAGLSHYPNLTRLINGFFFFLRGPNPSHRALQAPPGQAISRPNLKPINSGPIRGLIYKKKIIKKSQIKSTIPIQISYSQKTNTFEIKLFTKTKYILNKNLRQAHARNIKSKSPNPQVKQRESKSSNPLIK